jgi:hypothetical protein
MYYNTTDNTLWWWDGTAWISHVVAPLLLLQLQQALWVPFSLREIFLVQLQVLRLLLGQLLMPMLMLRTKTGLLVRQVCVLWAQVLNKQRLVMILVSRTLELRLLTIRHMNLVALIR